MQQNQQQTLKHNGSKQNGVQIGVSQQNGMQKNSVADDGFTMVIKKGNQRNSGDNGNNNNARKEGRGSGVKGGGGGNRQNPSFPHG